MGIATGPVLQSRAAALLLQSRAGRASDVDLGATFRSISTIVTFAVDFIPTSLAASVCGSYGGIVVVVVAGNSGGRGNPDGQHALVPPGGADGQHALSSSMLHAFGTGGGCFGT
jgi:hypothetical protein